MEPRHDPAVPARRTLRCPSAGQAAPGGTAPRADTHTHNSHHKCWELLFLRKHQKTHHLSTRHWSPPVLGLRAPGTTHTPLLGGFSTPDTHLPSSPPRYRTPLSFPPNLPSVPGLANSHTDAQVSMTEVAKDSHPDFPLHHVGCPVIQGERVRRGADGRRPDNVPLHLNAFGRRERRWRPGYSPRCAAKAGDELVPQLPGSPV